MRSNLPRKYEVLTIIFFFWLALYFQRINVSVLIVDPKFLADMGLINDTAGQGLLMTLFLLAYSFINILSAPLSDRIGPSKVMVAASVIAAVTVFLGGFAASLAAIFWIRILIGLGQGLYFPAQSKLISNWFLPHERGKANSIWAVAGCAGPIIAVPLFTWVIAVWSWHYVFFITGIISLVVLIVPVLKGPFSDSPNHIGIFNKAAKKSTPVSPKANLADIKNLLSSTNIWLLIVSYVALLSLWWGLVTWLPQYLVVVRNFTWASMGFVATLPYLTAGLAMLIGGFVGDKVKNQAWFGVFGFLGAAICIIMAVYTKSNISCALLVAAGLGFNQLYFAPIWSVLQTMLPVTLVATGSGIMNGFGNFFSGLAPLIIGVLIQITNTYNAGLIYLAVLGIIGSITTYILAVRLRERY